MSSRTLWKWDGFKSRWDVFRSQSHEYHLSNELTPWMVKTLQILKFLIFSVSHLLLVFGTAASKLAVILLATSSEMKTSEGYYEKKCYTGKGKTRSADVTTSMVYTLWLIQNIPDIMAIIQSLFRIYKHPKERKSATLMVFIMECCRSTGLAILFFYVFPSLDPLHCLILSVSVVFIPLYLRIKNLICNSFDPAWTLRNRLKLLVRSCSYSMLFLIVFASCYLWSISAVPFFKHFSLPLGLILSSFGYWDLWINEGHSISNYRYLYQLKYGIRKMSSMTRLVVSLLRILTSSAVVWIVRLRYLPFKALKKSLIENMSGSERTVALYNLALWIIFLNFLLRFISRMLSAMSMRILPVLHPLLTVVPLLITVFMTTCFISPVCAIREYLSGYDLRWQCLAWKISKNSLSEICFGVIWLATYLCWAYQQVKAPKFNPDDDVFDTITNVLNGLTIEQSLVVYRVSLNKKKVEDNLRSSESEGVEIDGGDLRITNDEIDKTVTLYICATMWHETRVEMSQMLKSIVRLDKEHSLALAGRRRPAAIRYRLEAHIFFDDAWEDQLECGRTPNAFFQTFFHLLLELTQNEITSEEGVTKDRVLLNTAYGGRLVVRLPAGTLLFVHLKDKQLVRHKKRWSQVMYLYYLLGHRIMDSHMSVEDRQLEADNTYILAIDGDSKFEPSAVMKLLRLMNMKNEIGCACGRIHPIGEGLMIWYQKFEYAISHWFQKAAEHVFGCVLCAPGCFSLFRASALMDDNVMHKYTKIACEPRHFVQYDQGEDRWLSTLLLKQGYRIEYAAVADAETYAPEGFREFFNQRRRWTPSSIANTVDLLADYKRVCQNNNSISKMYILYQSVVIGFSLLSPGIVFTMLVYAQVATFEAESNRMLLYNSLPVFIFIALCFLADSNYQIIFAKFISVVYGFVMLAVAVATTNQIILERLIFFLMIPCTYIFMALYALINLNVINWGTREAASVATGGDADDIGLSNLLQRLGLYKVVDFVRSVSSWKSTTTSTVAATAEVQEIKKKIANIETEVQQLKDVAPSTSAPLKTVILKENTNRFLWMDVEYLQVCSRGRLNAAEDEFWNGMIEQYLKDRGFESVYLQTGDSRVTSINFQPLEITDEETRRNVASLASLRNRIASSVLIVNGLLVLAVFLIQKHKEILSFQYRPYEGFEWSKLSKKTGKFELTDEPLKVEPIGLFIIAFLLIILVVQTCGMFAHRVNTLVGAFHEVSNMEDFNFSDKHIENEDRIMENARQMFDATLYENAHGADGYIRVYYDAHATCNVLYRLQQARMVQRSTTQQISKL
uniref:chitin synthase n=1 Tax=Setaria digitata TaxID=48799 RepID=A0A915PKW5_9BILA